MTITGNLGKVMKESATIAMEYIKANADVFGIKQDVFEKYNVKVYPTNFIIDILDYANTSKYKTVRIALGSDRNGSGEVGLFSGLWQSTAAVTTIAINCGQNYTTTSQFALYGIKG